MKAIEPADMFRLAAAEGWIELGCPGEAQIELEEIDASLEDHPDVIEVRWQLLAAQHRWPAALEAGRRLLDLAPDRVTGWLHHAYALRRTPEGGLRAAWNALAPALEKFPDTATVPYNLACYACQLDQLDAARAFFQRALGVGKKERLKQMALNDRDLEPLWKEIKEM
jgi:tetratricopeptide (TPR) repeat protein